MAKEVKFNIKLTIDGKEQLVTATTNVKKFAEEFEKARSKSTRLRDDLLKITQVGASFQNAINGLQQLTGIMRSYTDANTTQIEAETKLATVMRQRMGASDAEVDSIKKLASAQQELGVIGDEVQLAGAQQIATFINQKSSLETLIPAMNNLLAQQKGLSATGEDAVTIGNLMGKAMQGQSSALRRVGITFTEAQEKILKFGTESQRASMLAQIITDNVGDMNAELAKTDAGKAKQTANYIGDLKEEVGALFESIEPTIVAAGELGMAFMAVGTTVSGIKGIYVGLMGLTTAVKVSTVSTYAQAAASKIAAAAQFLWSKQLYYGREAFIAWTLGAKLAAVQAVAMRAAIMGLMAVTGVGLAIMAVSSIISLFANNTDGATDSMKSANREINNAREETERLKSIEQATNNAYTDAASAIGISKEKLKNLIDVKKTGKDISKEEKKIVGQLNDTYGDTMGYFDSVVKWYDALIQNSKAYCQQMVAEAKTRTLANQIAEKEAETHDIRYDDKGHSKKYSKAREQKWVVTGYSSGGYQQGEYKEVAGSSDWDKANQKIKDNQAVIANLRKQMEESVKEASQIEFKVKGSAQRPDTSTKKKAKTGTEKVLIENAKTYKDLTNNVAYYQQEIEKCDVTDTERIKTLLRAKAATETGLKAFNDMTEAASVPAELKTLDDYEKKLAYLRKQKQTANKEAIAGIDAEIKETEAARQALEDEGVAALKVGEIKTYDQLNKKLAYYNRLLSSGDKAQREFAQKGINDLNKLQEAWDSELEATKLPATTNNLKDIDAAISFYSDRQQREDADQIQRTQRIIDDLTSKKKFLQLGFEIPNMQREVADINALNGKEKRLKIRGIGFDELTNKIKELNKLLNDTENPVTDSQRKDIESLIAIYERWRKQSISSFETMRNGWDSVKGIGDSVQSITDALEGNGDAWQKITAIVDGFIQLYEGIQSIVKIIGLFTSTTKKQGAAEAGKTAQTAAGTAAIAGETAATVANTTASIANTAAKSGEAVAGATASGAKMPFPYNLIAIAAGVAAVISALAAIGSFSTGGIVGGNSPTGDRLFARVNSGEMILNKNQQQRLLQMLSGAGRMSYPAIDMRQPENVNYNINSNMLQPAGDAGGTVRFEIDGRKLVGVIANETRISSKSGRRTNIKI